MLPRPNPTWPFATLLCVAVGLTSGCIEEDPQTELLRRRLETTESQLATLSKQLAASDEATAKKEQATAPKGRIEELEAEVRSLKEQNARLQEAQAASSSSTGLSDAELFRKLDEASVQLREQLKSLYRIQQASLRELTIPETPYSCIVRLDLVNLATQAAERVDIPASANVRGEWQFPPLDQIAGNIRPVPSASTPQFSVRPAERAQDSPPRVEAAPGSPSYATPAAVSRPNASTMHVPGELAGEKVLPLNW